MSLVYAIMDLVGKRLSLSDDQIDKKPPHYQKYWEVAIGGWKMPWNKQIKTDRKAQKRNKKLSWAEQEHTIYEVGSTYTIQGFDLNYVGVILGPSVKYRDGKNCL